MLSVFLKCLENCEPTEVGKCFTDHVSSFLLVKDKHEFVCLLLLLSIETAFDVNIEKLYVVIFLLLELENY